MTVQIAKLARRIPRPSSLPMLKVCPCFDGQGSKDTDEGRERHAALKDYLEDKEFLLNALDEEGREAVIWAADYIRMVAPLSDHPAKFEEKISITLPKWEQMEGTPDAVCGPEVFDLKWRPRDYDAQMAAYAWGRLQELPEVQEVRVHVLFGATKNKQVYTIDAETAEAIVMPIVEKANDPGRKPNPCEYCSMCANKLKCEALNIRAQTVAAGREDWKLANYHSSELTDPQEMAKALALASHLEKWTKAVKHHAREMVVKQGLAIPGWELKTKAGKSSCHDVTGAFNATGLPVEVFLKCAELRLNRSKTNPNKEGLIEAYAQEKDLPKTAAKKLLKKTLEPFMRTPPEVQYLKSLTQKEEEEGDE